MYICYHVLIGSFNGWGFPRLRIMGTKFFILFFMYFYVVYPFEFNFWKVEFWLYLQILFSGFSRYANWSKSFIYHWTQICPQRETSYDFKWFSEWKFWGFHYLKDTSVVIQFPRCIRFPFEKCFFYEWIHQTALGPILKFKFPLFWTSRYITQSILSIHSLLFRILRYWWTYQHSNWSHQFKIDALKIRNLSHCNLCKGLFHGRSWSFLMETLLKDLFKTNKASSSWTFCNYSPSLPTIRS